MNFPQSGVISEKSSLILSLYCHIRLICISIFDVTRSWCRVNVMKKLIFHENINTLMIVWSLLLCGMPGHKANYFFRLLLFVIIWPVGRGFFETRGGGGWGRKILRRPGEPPAGAGPANDSISVMVPVLANGVITLTIQTTRAKNATDHYLTKGSGWIARWQN